MKQLSLGLYCSWHNDIGAQFFAEKKAMYLEMTDVASYFIYMAYSFINSVILILLISNFRKPFERLAKLLCKVWYIAKNT